MMQNALLIFGTDLFPSVPGDVDEEVVVNKLAEGACADELVRRLARRRQPDEDEEHPAPIYITIILYCVNYKLLCFIVPCLRPTRERSSATRGSPEAGFRSCLRGRNCRMRTRFGCSEASCTSCDLRGVPSGVRTSQQLTKEYTLGPPLDKIDLLGFTNIAGTATSDR